MASLALPIKPLAPSACAALLENVEFPGNPASYPSRRLPQRSSRGAVATKSWVQCGWKADLYDNKVALAFQSELIKTAAQDVEKLSEDACLSRWLVLLASSAR